MGFVERLEARVAATGSLVCVGVDPHPEDLARLEGDDDADKARRFGLALVAACAPSAAAFKPNAAFFEALGAAGHDALRDVIAAVPDEVPVLLDVKRGDISSTAAAYARAAFDGLGADAVTVNAWMGGDAVRPFTAYADKGAFVLARTSNPGGADVQDAHLGGDDGRREAVWERVARLAPSWGAPGQVGLVVGATKPAELARARALAPDAWILAPGVGAQGASLEDACAAGLRADGSGLLIAVSRGISRAADPAAAAAAYADACRAARASGVRRAAEGLRDRVAAGLLRVGCVRFGTFTLKSGLESPIYLDLRRLIADPALLADASALYAERLADLTYDVVAPLPYAAMPIGTAVCLQTGDPMVYPRREVKAYGTKAQVEGVYEAGQVAVVLDDLATTGGSKIEGIEKLASVGLGCTDIVVLVDRQSGADAAMAEVGVRLHAVFTLTELLDRWQGSGAIGAAQAEAVRAFLAAPGA